VSGGPAGTASAAADLLQARMAFLLALRARGLADVAVLRALEMAPREMFAPRRYLDLALRDVALPIECGQTMPEPYLVGRMMEALALDRSCRVLEVGAGSGFATAILAQLAGSTLSFERYRALAVEAQTRLQALGLSNAQVVWGDGLSEGPAAGPFERIAVHGVLDSTQALDAALAPEGIMVFARRGADGRRWLVRRVRRAQGYEETLLAPCRLGSLEPSRSACL
jgi:protein-L-isoaspartate(D-aspartate) O-methyltransferase